MTIPVERIDYHRQGSICAKGQMRDDQLHGYWEWYRKDGSLKRSGHFDDGVQVGDWTTYDANGAPYKVTKMKSKL
jgi:antitoxin component YwqK of YwqJK toxin-antitoxin module